LEKVEKKIGTGGQIKRARHNWCGGKGTGGGTLVYGGTMNCGHKVLLEPN